MFIENTKPLVNTFISWKIQRNQECEAMSFKSGLDRFLNYIADNKPWSMFIGDLERRDMEDYLVYLRTVDYKSSGQKAYRNSFVYRNLRAVNKFLEYLAINMEDGVAQHLPKVDLIHKADFPQPNQRGIKHFPIWLDKLISQEIKKLPETSPKQLRFKTMMVFIYHTGARVKDLCTLEKDCILKKLGYNWVRIFSNKTKQYYEVPINNEVHRYLMLYGEVAAQSDGSLHPTTKKMVEFMFTRRETVDGLKKSIARGIRGFGHELRRKALEKGLPVDDIEDLSLTSHKYRHNVGIKLTRMGADPLLVAEFLGHTHLSMAQAYIQEDEQEIEELMNELIADDSFGLNSDGGLIDNVLLTKQDIIDHCGIVSKVEGGWCTHFDENPPCGEAVYECWKCESLRPDFEDSHYFQKLQTILEDHEMLWERNNRRGLLGAAKAEEFVIARIRGFMKEVKGYDGAKENI